MILHALTAIDFKDLHLSPVLLSIAWGGHHYFDIKWYSIAYIAGIAAGWMYMMRLLRAPGAPMAKRHVEDLVFYATLGVILGGRIGYVLFYDPHFPSMLFSWGFFKLWEGGMSFHGGVLGVTLGIILFARRHKLDWLRTHDYVACCAPMGLFFGRLANFVNGELWGRPTDVAWGIIFPSGGPEPRHPSQLYEAGLEGLVLFAILWFAFWRTKARYEPGKLVGLFILFYGLFRYFIEFFREPDGQYADSPLLGTAGTHMGQLLCVPMILGGIYLVWTAKNRRQRVTPIAGDESVA